MNRFGARLREIHERIDLPQPLKSRIILEIASDMNDTYEELRGRGLGEEEAARRAARGRRVLLRLRPGRPARASVGDEERHGAQGAAPPGGPQTALSIAGVARPPFPVRDGGLLIRGEALRSDPCAPRGSRGRCRR